MRIFSTVTPAIVLAIATLATAASAQTIIDFEDVGATLPNDTAFLGADQSGGFTSGPGNFTTEFDPTFGSWTGTAYSNRTSWTLGGASGFEEFQFGNDTAVAEPGGGSGVGAGGSDTWGVLFGFTPNATRFEIAPGQSLQGLSFNNTRTTANVLENGNSFSPAFGANDRFEVIFNSLQVDIVNGVEQVTVLGSSDPIVLADGTSIVNDWTFADFTGTAIENATLIGVEFRSTDSGVFGINTPAFVAIDNLVLAVPEPNVSVLLVLSGLGLLRRRQRTA